MERLCRKKILLILDDVDNRNQLQALAGQPDWFGPGSRVIITTRDKHLLSNHKIERRYAIEQLNKTESLELLRWTAFEKGKVPSSYEDVLNRFVAYASGLPLVIKVGGSTLFERSTEVWECTLDEYEKIPNKEIQKILKVSYDALEEKEQSVFLDIACCFKGCRLTEIEDILHAHYGVSSISMRHRIQVLAEKSLISINDYYHDVTLHDLIEDMGKEIVRQESPKKFEKRSRLWLKEDIIKVLEMNKENNDLEIISLNCSSTKEIIDWNEAFEKMTSLKTLIIKGGNFSKGSIDFPSNLRVLTLENFQSKCITSSFLNKMFKNMKILKFDNCEYLTEIPDISNLPNLENFSFQNCENLNTVHSSIRLLNKLKVLNASGCVKLKSFPPLKSASLKTLLLKRCTNLQNFPEILDKNEAINSIDILETSIRHLPDSFQNLTELTTIFIVGCVKFSFPSILSKMPKLSTISVGGFPTHLHFKSSSDVTQICLLQTNLSDEYLLKVLTLFSNFEILNLTGSNFKILPEFLKECRHLRELAMSRHVEEIRGIPPNLDHLKAKDCKSLNSSSRSMLINQELHEARRTKFCFPVGSERIPKWFEHQSIGSTKISFWFRNKMPSLTFYFSTERKPSYRKHNFYLDLNVKLFINGHKYTFHRPPSSPYFVSDHIYLLYLDLDGVVNRYYDKYEKLESNLEEAFLKKEWIHIELELERHWRFRRHNDEPLESLHIKFGIHLSKKENNLEDVMDTPPQDTSEEEEWADVYEDLGGPLGLIALNRKFSF